MDIRLLTGRYAGEIRDIPVPEARLMLADGRGEDPYADTADLFAQVDISPKPAAKPKSAKKK